MRFMSICVSQYLLLHYLSDFGVKIADSWKNSIVICPDLRVSCCHRFIESLPCCLASFLLAVGEGRGCLFGACSLDEHVGDSV
jgi:hypothetical protein